MFRDKESVNEQHPDSITTLINTSFVPINGHEFQSESDSNLKFCQLAKFRTHR